MNPYLQLFIGSAGLGLLGFHALRFAVAGHAAEETGLGRSTHDHGLLSGSAGPGD